MTKNHDAMLFIADSTRERMHSGQEELVHAGDFEVRGRVAKLTVWTISAAAANPSPRELPETETAASSDGRDGAGIG